MKYEVSVKADYVPSWGLKDAFREFGSNAFDAEQEMGAKASISYRNGTVYIENDDVTIPREALLFGHTTKYGDSAMIGQFGEGLKLACLAAVRAGYDIRIRSGNELWKPSMQESKTFKGTQVLTFDITTGKAEKNRVVVEMHGIGPDQWKEFQSLFLRLQNVREEFLVKTNHGTLLIDPSLVGKVYVKGVWVENDMQLQAGYDLCSAKVDRDRKLVERWDRDHTIKNIWFEAATKKDAVRDRFIKALENEDADVRGIDQWSSSYVPEEVAKQVAAKFRETHGDNAVPVLTLSESQDMEHLGKKGVVVSKPMMAVVTKEMGSLDKIKAGLRTEAMRSYSWGDLNELQHETLQSALNLLSKVREVSLDDVDVVDFRSKDIEGMFKDGRVLLASKFLGDPHKTLQVLVHEVAHRAGGDGAHSHVQEIEEIWMTITRFLLTGEISGKA